MRSFTDTRKEMQEGQVLSSEDEQDMETESDSGMEASYGAFERDLSDKKVHASKVQHRCNRYAPQFIQEGLIPSFFDEHCSNYMTFTDDNPTTYHAIAHCSQILENAGFEYKAESENFGFVSSGGRFYIKRGGQSLVACVVGKNWMPANGIAAIGCHIDALTLKLKPCSVKRNVHGYQLLGVAPYSGALNNLWLDRDLGIGGFVLFRDRLSGKIGSKLVSSGRHAICRIPSLAPHFGVDSASVLNKETNMVPVMGFSTDGAIATEDEKTSPLYGKHSIVLLRYVAKLADIKVSQILLIDMDLYDVQPAARGGISNEFMFAPRIDDRLCAYSAVHALTDYSRQIGFNDDDGFLMVLLANHEEIGSATRTGAKAKLLNSVLERVLVSKKFNTTESLVVFANSIILSADVTHALNPNFVESYLTGHSPLPNKGLVLKMDSNGHVMTDLTGVALMNSIAKKNGLTLQQFQVRNDKPSGGTIGPMLAIDTGARVIDVGLAQLSMHSVRAAAGFKEPGIGVLTFECFFRCWREAFRELDYN